LENGTAKREKQDDSQSTYAKMLSKDLGNIDWNQDAVSIERLIRGLNPWPSAYTSIDGKILKIWDADVVEDREGSIGTIVCVNKADLIVKTGNGCLALREIQLAGKKRMETKVFLLGYQVKVGTRLG